VIEYSRERLSRDEMIAAARAFLETLRKRRTVREFSSDPVPDEVIDLAIEAAASAPSGANQQPWKFVVVRDLDVKREIRIAAEKEEYENYHGRMPEEWLRARAPLTHTPSPMGFLREILKRPKNEKAYLLVPVGYPAEGCRVPDIKKKPLGEVRQLF